jgi:hypothetical protein
VEDTEIADLWRFFRWCSLPPAPDWHFENHGHRSTAVATARRFQGFDSLRHQRRLELDWHHGIEITDDVLVSRAKLPAWGLHFYLGPDVIVGNVSEMSLELGIGDRDALMTVHSDRAVTLEVYEDFIAKSYGIAQSTSVVRVTVHDGHTGGKVITKLMWSARS